MVKINEWWKKSPKSCIHLVFLFFWLHLTFLKGKKGVIFFSLIFFLSWMKSLFHPLTSLHNLTVSHFQEATPNTIWLISPDSCWTNHTEIQISISYHLNSPFIIWQMAQNACHVKLHGKGLPFDVYVHSRLQQEVSLCVWIFKR